MDRVKVNFFCELELLFVVVIDRIEVLIVVFFEMVMLYDDWLNIGVCLFSGVIMILIWDIDVCCELIGELLLFVLIVKEYDWVFLKLSFLVEVIWLVLEDMLKKLFGLLLVMLYIRVELVFRFWLVYCSWVILELVVVFL